MKSHGGLRDSGCVCAGGRGPSGASSSFPAARRHSSFPSSAAAPHPQSTDAPRHSLVSPERSGRKEKTKAYIRRENHAHQREKERELITTVKGAGEGEEEKEKMNWKEKVKV